MKLNIVQILGYVIILISALICFLVSFNPSMLLKNGDTLETGFLLSKTLFIVAGTLCMSIFGYRLTNNEKK